MNTPHVLIVEDDADNRKILAYHVRKLGGVTYSEAGDGREALEAVQNGGADLIIMDVNMPVMDGLAATRAIRALESNTRNVPILALTAANTAEDQRDCMDAGVTDFLAKPIVDPQTLRAKIQECLDRAQGRKNGHD